MGRYLLGFGDLILVLIYFPFSMIKSLTNQRIRLVGIPLNSIIPYGIPLIPEGRRDRLPYVRVIESFKRFTNLGVGLDLSISNLLIHSSFFGTPTFMVSHKEKLRFFLPSSIGLKSINKGLFLKFLPIRIGSKDMRKSLSGIGSPYGFLKTYSLAFLIPFGIL